MNDRFTSWACSRYIILYYIRQNMQLQSNPIACYCRSLHVRPFITETMKRTTLREDAAPSSSSAWFLIVYFWPHHTFSWSAQTTTEHLVDNNNGLFSSRLLPKWTLNTITKTQDHQSTSLTAGVTLSVAGSGLGSRETIENDFVWNTETVI